MVALTNIPVENPFARSFVPFSRHEFLPIRGINETYPFDDL